MLVNDKQSAEAWLRAWDGKPRRGILLACMEGAASEVWDVLAARYRELYTSEVDLYKLSRVYRRK